MTDIFQQLNTFVDRAEKMGKYPANSAGALRATAKLAASLISEEEPKTLEYFREHAEEIFARSREHSAPSIHTYINRARRLSEDYATYGLTPSAMLNWKVGIRAVRKSRKDQAAEIPQAGASAEMPASVPGNSNVLMLALRENIKARLEVPADLTGEEAERICALIRSLATFGKK